MSKHIDDTDDLVQRELARNKAIQSIAHAITPVDAAAGHDVFGDYTSSLTEAVMGISKGLDRVANALESIADAIRETKQ